MRNFLFESDESTQEVPVAINPAISPEINPAIHSAINELSSSESLEVMNSATVCFNALRSKFSWRTHKMK